MRDITEKEIHDWTEKVAYGLWEALGKQEGKDLHYWLIAKESVIRWVLSFKMGETLSNAIKKECDDDIINQLKNAS